MLVKTEAVMKARVTMGTSKYHASSGSRAAPSIASVSLDPTLLGCGETSREHWPR